MAGEIPDLEAQVRTGTGKGAARQARREGMVPGIVYGGGQDPQPIKIPFNRLLAQLKAGRFMSRLWNLKVEGQDDVRVICRNVQRDVVKDLPTHLDLMRLKRTSRVDLFIHVEFVTVVRPEVELSVVAGDIPERLVADLEGMDIGDTLTISDIALPEGARPTIDRDFVICNISAPSGLKASESEDEEDETEADEVPTVGSKDDDEDD